LSATAKPHAIPATIGAKRHQWIEQGKDRQLRGRCRSATRYVVEGADPPRVFWLLETDDPGAAALITEHFGDLWDIRVDQVVPQPIGGSTA
jgi:hypothetical protein